MLYKNKGFTLIELLVVIAIIGLLASIVLVSLNSARAKARDTKRIADLKQIRIALEMYYDTNNNYPVATTAVNSSSGSATWISGLSPSYITSVPADPTNSGTGSYYYYYKTTAGGASYELNARMENNTAEATGDGGNNSTYYETGTGLTILSSAVPPT